MQTLRSCVAILLLAGLSAAGTARPAAGELLNPVVRFTIYDTISFDVELFANETPATVANFLGYVTTGRYTNTILHRSTTNLEPPANFNHVVQGGGFTKLFDFAGPEITPIITDPPIANTEAGLLHEMGTIAMARGEDPASATSQWFFNTKDNPELDSLGYTVFGRIISGMEVLEDLAALPVAGRLLEVYTNLGIQETPFPELPLYVEAGQEYLVTVTSIALVPEPGTWSLAAIGLAAAAWATRRHRRTRG